MCLTTELPASIGVKRKKERGDTITTSYSSVSIIFAMA
jgi:hypothetical protein